MSLLIGLALLSSPLEFVLDAPPPQVAIEEAPAPLAADVAALKARVAALEAQVAELKARCGAVEVVRAVEVHSPAVRPKVGPLATTVQAATTVATTPAKVVRQICSGGQCRLVEVDAVSVEPANYSESPNSCQACQGGNCYRPQRRGWFGRRR